MAISTEDFSVTSYLESIIYTEPTSMDEIEEYFDLSEYDCTIPSFVRPQARL